MKNLILFLFVLNFTNPLYSQLDPEWIKRYDNISGYSSYVTDMKLDLSGNVYITGYVLIDSQNADVLTIKYNTSGNVEWSKLFDNGLLRNDRGVAIQADKFGNVYVLAQTDLVNQPPVTKPAATLLKYSPNGSLVWKRSYMNLDSLFNLPVTMTIDDSSNCYIVCGAYVENQSTNCLTLKYDADGNFKWSNFFDNTAHTVDAPRDVILDTAQNVYMLGSSFSTTLNRYFLNLVKYDPAGKELWVLKDTTFFSRKILIDKTQNISLSSSGGVTLVKKFNQNRELLQEFDYSNPQINPNSLFYKDFILDNNNNPIVATSCVYTGELGFSFLTIRYGDGGDTVWTQKFNPVLNSNDETSSIAIDKNGNCIVTGKSNYNMTNNRFVTIIYSSNGQQRYVLQYQGSGLGNHEAIKVLTDTIGNIYVTGNSQTNTGIDGIATIKYSALTSIHQNSFGVPEKLELFQNYPNPFNPVTNIKLNLPKSSYVMLKVFDITGREIIELANKFLTYGEYIFTWNATDFASGIYYYSLFVNGNLINTKQLVLIK